MSRPNASLTSKAAFSVGESLHEPHSTQRSAIYVYTKEKDVRRLKSGEWLDREPSFTDGGELLGFLSNRRPQANGSGHAATNLLILTLEGSNEVWRALVPGHVEGFEWMSSDSALMA